MHAYATVYMKTVTLVLVTTGAGRVLRLVRIHSSTWQQHHPDGSFLYSP